MMTPPSVAERSIGTAMQRISSPCTARPSSASDVVGPQANVERSSRGGNCGVIGSEAGAVFN
jgi:hypothetical protein